MPKFAITLAIVFAMIAAACSGPQSPATPLETFKTYTKALKRKDTTTMKLLLSAETLKAHEREAKEMGTTVDEIIKRESLIGEGQTSVEYRNETIDGERATLEVKAFGDRWETIYFLFENGEWKIDKKGSADRLLQEIEEANRLADEQNKIDRAQPDDTVIPTPQVIEPMNPNSNDVNR